MFVDPLNGYMCVSGGLFDHSASGVNIGILNWELVDNLASRGLPVYIYLRLYLYSEVRVLTPAAAYTS